MFLLKLKNLQVSFKVFGKAVEYPNLYSELVHPRIRLIHFLKIFQDLYINIVYFFGLGDPIF